MIKPRTSIIEKWAVHTVYDQYEEGVSYHRTKREALEKYKEQRNHWAAVYLLKVVK